MTGLIICPVCKKELTPETNDEQCPDSPYRDGKHPIFVIDLTKIKPEFRFIGFSYF